MQITDSDNFINELQNKEVDYGQLFENMQSAFGYCKMIYGSNGKPIDLKILQVNNAIEKIFGKKKSEIIGRKFTDVIPSSFKEHPEILEISSRVVSTGKAEEFEVYINFVKIWIYVSIFTPKKGHIIFIFENITKRKNYEEKLKNSLEKFSDLANCLPELVFEIDLNGKTTYVNRIAFETTGYTQDDLLSKGPFNLDFFLAENIEKAKKDFATVQKTSSTITNEYVIKKKDGSTFNALVKSAPIRMGNKIIGVRGIIRDITEQKKTTETLVFQSQLLEAVGQALIASDKDKIIRYWNKGAASLFGWTAEEVIGKSTDEVQVGFPLDQINIISNVILSGKSYSSENKIRNRDGVLVHVITTCNPIYSKEGEFIGVISVHTDITSQKEIESKLAGYVEEYALATKKIKDLNEKLRVIASFTRHDIRNKLGTLNGYMYMIKKKIEDKDAAMKYLMKMDEATKQLLAILEFEKVYEQIGSEELVYVNVERYFAEAASLISDFKGVNIKCDCEGLEVFADSLLRQLLYNLMDNTIKYGQKTTTIKLYSKKDENSMLLVYEDDGEGISDEVRARLFEKGFGRGTGFGLYMIKRIIEAYGWSIEENGKLGVGAKFTIKIPENKFKLKENV